MATPPNKSFQRSIKSSAFTFLVNQENRYVHRHT